MKIHSQITLFIFAVLFGIIMTGCGPQPTGLLSGTVHVGPLTPVERVGVPTPIPPPEVFTTRGITIHKENGALVTTQYFSPDGTYSVSLPIGTYRVELITTGIDRADELPAIVVIHENQNTILNLTIDTGIR